MYRSFLRPCLFQLPAEQAHRLAIGGARWLQNAPFWRDRVQAHFLYSEPLLTQTLFGLSFTNPLGLAAGFDKNGEAIQTWQSLGFGFAEIGTVTAQAQPGNPQPRLFRLPCDRAILNRLGFNNAGATTIANSLANLKRQLTGFPIGINLGKSKITPLDRACEDYIASFRILYAWGDYFTINVSSPNTPNLRDLQGIDALAKIIDGITIENYPAKPLLLKIAPDLADGDIEAIADLCLAKNIAGIIATNTTTRRDNLKTQMLYNQPIGDQAGGISGEPLRCRSTAVIRLIWQHTQGKLPIVGVGGITSVADAWQKIGAGASLLQIYTGLVYEGPALIKEILMGITDRMRQKNYTDWQQAVGWENK